MTYHASQRIHQAPVELVSYGPTSRCSDEDAAIIRSAVAMQDALGISNSDAAKRAEIKMSTYSEVKRFVYKGDYAEHARKLARWLDVEETRLKTETGGLPQLDFIETSMAKQMLTAMKYAQSKPAMCLITVGAGNGKTSAIRHFANASSHAHRIVIEPTDGRAQPAIRKIAAALSISGFHVGPLLAELKRRLSREAGQQPVLLIDEAQNLSADAVNALRFLLDEAGCGIVLSGNEDLMARYSMASSREGYGQVHRRIFMRVHIRVAPIEDINIILGALRITDPHVIRLCRQIGTRVGGIGGMVETLEFASQLAFGKGDALGAEHVRSAWMNRANEELR